MHLSARPQLVQAASQLRHTLRPARQRMACTAQSQVRARTCTGQLQEISIEPKLWPGLVSRSALSPSCGLAWSGTQVSQATGLGAACALQQCSRGVRADDCLLGCRPASWAAAEWAQPCSSWTAAWCVHLLEVLHTHMHMAWLQQ